MHAGFSLLDTYVSRVAADLLQNRRRTSNGWIWRSSRRLAGSRSSRK